MCNQCLLLQWVVSHFVDAIYEEALATREAYCSSLISTASALQAREEQGPPVYDANGSSEIKVVEVVKQVEKPRPPVADACVGTEGEWTQETTTASGTKPKSEAPAEKATPSKSSPSKILEEEESSSDVLSVFLGMIFSSFFGLVWLVLFRIPFRIFSFSLLLVSASAFASVMWLYLADDHGAQMMGAGIPYGFNRGGIV